MQDHVTCTSVDFTLKERGSIYGDFGQVATCANDIKQILRIYNLIPERLDHLDSSHRLRNVEREALDMVASKLARIMCGKTFHVDNWVDIAGYAQLVINEYDASRAKEPSSDTTEKAPF